MTKKRLHSSLERWETPVVDWFLPGISLRHHDLGGVEVYVHMDTGTICRFYFEPLAFRVTSEPATGGLPKLESPFCSATCRNSEWERSVGDNAPAPSARQAAAKSTHFVIFGASWTFESLSVVSPIIELLDKLPSDLQEER